MGLFGWYPSTSKCETNKDAQTWKKGKKPTQIRPSGYRCSAFKPDQQIGNRFFSIFVMYLGFFVTPIFFHVLRGSGFFWVLYLGFLCKFQLK